MSKHYFWISFDKVNSSKMKQPAKPVERGNSIASLDYILDQEVGKDSSILDIGCNFGTLLNLLFEQGYKNIHGTDINASAIERGKKYYPNVKSGLSPYDGENLPFEDEGFDFILMFDVIEHIPELEKFLAEQVFRCLKPGGKFIFQTPNKYFNIIWEIIHLRSFTEWREFHVSLQTVSSLKRMLKRVGFRRLGFEKRNIYTEHNVAKAKKALGFPGIGLLKVVSKLPLSFTPNIWGSAYK